MKIRMKNEFENVVGQTVPAKGTLMGESPGTKSLRVVSRCSPPCLATAACTGSTGADAKATIWVKVSAAGKQLLWVHTAEHLNNRSDKPSIALLPQSTAVLFLRASLFISFELVIFLCYNIVLCLLFVCLTEIKPNKKKNNQTSSPSQRD